MNEGDVVELIAHYGGNRGLVTIKRVSGIKDEYSHWHTVYLVENDQGRQWMVGAGQIQPRDED